MPITGTLKRGDAVMINDTPYFVRPSGTTVYLYETRKLAIIGGTDHVRTISTRVLRRDGRRVKSQYLYVVRNCDLPRDIRELKIGITQSIPQMLRTYHRRNPNDQTVIVVDCENGDARSLERRVHDAFSDFRVDDSEVFEVRIHQVHRCLRRMGFVHEDDGIYRL